MKKLNWKKIITLSLTLALLTSLSVKFVFADDELTKFDNFKKVQSYKEGTFTDVKEKDWFHDNIVSLYEMKVMIGMTENLFDTENSLRVSEAMTLAARLNATYTGCELPAQGEGKNWFKPFADYCKEKEIAYPDKFDLNAPITRREFAEIFSKALPSEAYEEINNVKDGMIPDLTGSEEVNKEIYLLFRSGVLTGMDETRSFEPNRTIKRSEAAAVVSRIINPKLRIDLHLPKDEPVIPPVPEKKTSGGGGGSSGGGGGGGNPPAPTADYAKEPLTLSNTGSVTAKISIMDDSDSSLPSMPLQYKIEDGEWRDYTFNDVFELEKGKKVYFKAKNKLTSLGYYTVHFRHFNIDDDNDFSTPISENLKVEVSGNIMSLIDPNLETTDLSGKDAEGKYLYQAAFANLFAGCDAILNAKNLILPAEKLPPNVYGYMFYRCHNLQEGPSELPAKILTQACYYCMFGESSITKSPVIKAEALANACYSDMFLNCKELKEAPELPLTELADACYCEMFLGCEKLAEAPALPATTLVDGCYTSMFLNCKELKEAPELPATELASQCYGDMFEGCTSLTKCPKLPATELADDCYSSMFEGCTSLEGEVVLPAKELSYNSFNGMFSGCKKLNKLVTCFDDFSGFECITNWLCLEDGTFEDLTLYCTKAYYESIKDDRNKTTVPPEVNIVVLPDKGDIIYLDGQPEKYQVLSRDGLNVEVMSSEISNMRFYENDQNLLLGLFSDGNTYPLYAGSIVDNFLNGNNEGDFYHKLSSNIKNAIVEKDVVQNALMGSDTDPGEYIFDQYGFYTYEVGNKEVGKRNVYTISLEDVAKFIGTNIYDLELIYKAMKFVDSPVWLLNAINSYQGNVLLSLDYILHPGYMAGVDDIGVIPTFTVDITKVDYEIFNPENEYMYVKSNSNGTEVMVRSTYDKTPLPLEYSKDLTNWTPVNYFEEQTDCGEDYANGEAITLDSGEKVYFRKIAGETLPAEFGNTFFYFTDDDTEDSDPSTNSAKVELGGNIMGLIDETLALKDLTGLDHVFECLFDTNDALEIRADKLILPATTLSESCYSAMFYRCTHLISAPELPAMNLADYCYYYMFGYCKDLESAPDLPALTLKEFCYWYMFTNCTSLIDPPVMSAETMAYSSCESMFSDCSSLTYGIELRAMTLAKDCYELMYEDCTSLLNAPELPATTLAEACYEHMFLGCTSLEETPTIKAETLEKDCYYGMFERCSALTSAPALPIQTLADYCYCCMFDGCTGLQAAPALPATTLTEGCYQDMFSDCSNLTSAPTLPATTLADWCYYEMFSGCENLKNLDVSFTAFDTTNSSTDDWLDGVTGPVTVTCYDTLKNSGYVASTSTFPSETLFVSK